MRSRDPLGVNETIPASTDEAYCFPVKKGQSGGPALYELKSDWRVDLLDASGDVLETVKFNVE